MFFFSLFVIYIYFLFNAVFSRFNFQNEQVASTFLESNKNYIVTKEHIIDGIEKCWFNVTEYLINESIKQKNDFSNDIKTTVNGMKHKLDRLINVSYSHKKIDTVNASFQWAQSPEYIFLNIKFSHRWSSPGALKVKNEEIISKKNNFSFSALSNDTNTNTKKYIVNLTLLHNIIESETKYNFASVGKVVVTLKKEKKKIWNRLLLSKEKNPNMHVWWDMKEKYYQIIQDFLKEKKKNNEKIENIEQENGKNYEKENNTQIENINDKYEEKKRENNSGNFDDINSENADDESDEDYDESNEDEDEYEYDDDEKYEDDNNKNKVEEAAADEKNLKEIESKKKKNIINSEEL